MIDSIIQSSDHALALREDRAQRIADIANICHAANKAWCEAGGDNTQKHWDEAPDWQRESAIKGVEFAIANPNAPVSSQHVAWSQDKYAEGWIYGEVKDAEKKTHPCLVAFHELPPFQQAKDRLFRAIAKALWV